MRAQWDPQFPEACDNTLLIAERVDVGFTEGQDLMPRAPVPEGETEESWLVKEVERGLHQRFPNGVTDQYRKQAEYELGVIIQMGFPGYFLVVADLIQHAKSRRHPRRPRPRVGRGLARRVRPGHHRPRPDQAQADLRAVPQPRAHLDARHRHGLRRAPARRDDPLRHREVRRGPGRADHHLRHDQGEGRDQGLRAGAVRPPGYAVADRITKAMPPAIMGKDIPLSGHLRPRAQALHGGRRVPRALRGRPAGQGGHRHRPRARGPQAPVGRARRRRDHVERRR